MKKSRILWVLLPSLTIIATACTAAVTSPETPEVNPPTEAEPDIAPTTDSVIPSTTAEHQAAECEDPFDGNIPRFSTDFWNTNFCKHSVPFEEISSGGPPPDGIPPIDEPRFESIESADAWIEDVEPVIFLDLEGIARAYPLQIMTWHEIVNDQVGNTPVAVTFCPLCNTALVFMRPTIAGETLTFGTSGNLRNSDLVMWDRQTESWWQQFSGEAIVGDLTGTKLEFLPSAIVSWADFKANHPDGEVLSIDTGFNRSYGRNPYSGYDDVNSYPFLFTGEVDGRLPAMARVVGVLLNDGQGKAFSRSILQEELVLNEIVGDTKIVIFWKPGTASALDTGQIASGRDVGTTAVYLAELEGMELTFKPGINDTFIDQETGTTWDVFGNALSGPQEGSQLTPIPHHDTFWFAWGAFVPESDLVDNN
jgi:hypothetical protein